MSVPSSELGAPPPPSPVTECVSPLDPMGEKQHSLAGEGDPIRRTGKQARHSYTLWQISIKKTKNRRRACFCCCCRNCQHPPPPPSQAIVTIAYLPALLVFPLSKWTSHTVCRACGSGIANPMAEGGGLLFIVM